MLGIAKSPFQIRQHQTPTHRIAKVITIHRFTRAHGDSRGRSILEILFDVAPPIAQLFVAAFHLSPAGRRSRFYSAKKRKKGGEGEKKNYGAPINLISTEKFSIRWPFPDFSWFVGGKNGPSFSTVHHQNGRYILWPISTEINGNVSRIGDKIVLLDLGQDFFFFPSSIFGSFPSMWNLYLWENEGDCRIE